MPRKNKRSRQSEQIHRLDRFEKWAKAVINENQRQGQRMINNRKKEMKKHAET